MKLHRVAVGLVLIMSALISQSGYARAANTLVVTTAQDLAAPCTAAAYSLRCAITQANADSTNDTITFDITSGCIASTVGGSSVNVCTISPTSALPPLQADTTTIDGYTQAGAKPDTNGAMSDGDGAILTIRIDGTSAGSGVTGIDV